MTSSDLWLRRSFIFFPTICFGKQPRMPRQERKRPRSATSRASNSSAFALPVEVMAHLLRWTMEKQWLRLRLLSRKWCSAVACLMEGELTAQTYGGAWKPLCQRTVVRRLLLVSAPFMSPEVLHSVSAVHLGIWNVESPKSKPIEAELKLISVHFPRLEEFFCPGSVTDTGLENLVQRAPLKLLDLTGCKNVTEKGLREVSKLGTLTSLNLSGCRETMHAGLGEVAKLRTLTSLNLSGCELTDDSLSELSKLGALTSLTLTGCYQLSGAGLNGATSLKFLKLDCCYRITTAGLGQVAQLRDLTSLN
jgi:hypothetical protein